MSHANLAIFVPHVGCPNRCSFCNQRTISGQEEVPTPEQVRALCEKGLLQLKRRARESQIAFFGGSFTAIPRPLMCALLEAAAPFVGPEGFSGIRISTRPDAIDEEILALLKRYGVTALELGAQSMDNEVLRRNGRGHTAEQVRQAAALIRSASLELGLQMMTGLPGDSPVGAWETARAFLDLRPDTVRIYPTVVLEGTDLAAWQRDGSYRAMPVEEAVPLCAGLMDLFEEQGVRVIRVGLHASETLQGACIGGAYHPAFRELCEGERYLRKILTQLQWQNIPRGAVQILVHPGERSKAVGQRRCNLARLAQLGYQAQVSTDPHLPRGGVLVRQCEQTYRGQHSPLNP